MTKINKEYVKIIRGFHVAIYEDDYSSLAEKMNRLVEIAQRDFPTVKTSDISIVQYAGEFHKRKYMIEFSVPADTMMPNA